LSGHGYPVVPVWGGLRRTEERWIEFKLPKMVPIDYFWFEDELGIEGGMT